MIDNACCRIPAALLAIILGGLQAACSGSETTTNNESNHHDAGAGGDGAPRDSTAAPEGSIPDSPAEGAAGFGGTTTEAGTDAPALDAKDAGTEQTIVVEAGSDVACVNIGQLCSDTGSPCCSGYKCYSMAGTGLCLPEGSDAGQPDASCRGTLQTCASPSECCPGLDCMNLAIGSVCMTPLWDGGLPDSWLPSWDALTDGLCTNVYESCSQGGLCCPGLTCKTDPPNSPDPQCLPLIAPNPEHCPDEEPNGPCIELGLQCSYLPMTSCLCRFGGWECAH